MHRPEPLIDPPQLNRRSPGATCYVAFRYTALLPSGGLAAAIEILGEASEGADEAPSENERGAKPPSGIT